jgi:phospholipid/cholesterol/gamma-HCH transport system substrate-binding protein
MKFKNEVAVGIVVVVAIIVMVIGALWLSGKPWAEEQQELVAVFREVGELKEGNPVKFRGVQVGRVTEISLAPSGAGVLVTMEAHPGVDLPADPAVLLAPASLFGDWQASIVSRRSQPNLEFTSIAEPGVLPGASLPDITELTAVGARIAGDLETLAERVEIAFTEETAIKIRQTVENLQEISQQLTGFVDQQTGVYAEVSENVLVATENVADATEAVEQMALRLDMAVDPGEIEAIITNARLASENLQELTAQLDTVTAQVPGLLGEVEVTLQAVTQLVEQLQPAAAEVGPTLAEAQEALASLQRVTTSLEQGEGSLGRLLQDPALYEETQAAIATLRRILADIQEDPARYLEPVDVNVEVF